MNPSLSIHLDNIGKQFYRRWLFQGISLSLQKGDRLALVGTNGSGKSTLLRVIAGQLSPSLGSVSFKIDGKKIPADNRYRWLSWAAPYISVFPELTLPEQIRLQQKFQPFQEPEKRILKLLELEGDADKPLRYYSSGMLQRAKAGLAIFADSGLLLLDEPTSNMDDYFCELTLSLVEKYLDSRILVLASNLEREYGEIAHQIHLGKKDE